MSNTMQRVIVGCVLALIAGAAALGEYFGLPAVRWLGVAVVVAMIIEMVAMMSRNRAALRQNRNGIVCSVFMAWLVLMLFAIYSVGTRPWIILLLLLIISAADIKIADGIGVVKAARILGTPLKCKVAGVETGEEIIKKSGENGCKLFFLGGKPGVAEIAVEKLLEKYPKTDFAGLQHGYFKKEGEENNEENDKLFLIYMRSTDGCRHFV